MILKNVFAEECGKNRLFSLKIVYAKNDRNICFQGKLHFVPKNGENRRK
jgi:hypothetical protein